MPNTLPNTISLSKYISQSRYTSRRKAAELVKQGQIVVDGSICLNPGTRIDPKKSSVIHIQPNTKKQTNITIPQQYQYLMLNKPPGYLCTTNDPYNRKTIYQLLPKDTSVYPVGRLDQDSRGLLLLSNDGFFINHLTNPKFHVSKTYHVTILGKVSENTVDQLNKIASNEPVAIADIIITKPIQASIIKHQNNNTIVEFILKEGKKRQIRRMCAYAHLHILDLKRVKIGSIELNNLKEGTFRKLTKDEVQALFENLNLHPHPQPV